MIQPRHHRLRDLVRNDARILACLLLIAAGCAAPAPKRADVPSKPGSSATDPCATRMHDLLGGLLLYYATHNDLPPNLKSLELPSGNAADAISCPVSNQPYIYDPRGLPAPDGTSLLIIYDAVPAHGGFRWAVSIAEPKPGKPLIAEIVAAPESTFAVSAPR